MDKVNPEKLGQLTRQGLEATGQFFKPVVPYAVQASASAIGFSLGLGACQTMGLVLRVSCGTPVAGPVMGMLGVGFSSALAGQASLYSQQRLAAHPSGLLRLRAASTRPLMSRQDLLTDALVGIAAYKVDSLKSGYDSAAQPMVSNGCFCRMLGGRFRAVLPSDLCKPGAFAHESLPTVGAGYAGETSRAELRRLMRRDGCHHCGWKRGPCVGDHIPPNKLAWAGNSQAERLANSLASAVNTARKTSKWTAVKQGAAAVQSVLSSAGAHPRSAAGLQRFYPQCKKCCQLQAAAVRSNRTRLILHKGGPRSWYFAGVLVGLRHYYAIPGP